MNSALMELKRKGEYHGEYLTDMLSYLTLFKKKVIEEGKDQVFLKL